jgi:hypothetical protein
LIPSTQASEVNNDCKEQPLIAILEVNNKCPIGFSSTEGYCIPRSTNINGVIPIYNGIEPENCPFGYRKNNGYCQSRSSTLEKNLIPQIGKNCPRGYKGDPGSEFCIKNCY